jgi:hypothetical protein
MVIVWLGVHGRVETHIGLLIISKVCVQTE